MRSLYTVFFLLYLSCAPPTGNDDLTPASIGQIDEILVVMEKNHWSGEAGKSLRSNFQRAFPVLPQPESLFTLKHRNFAEFENRLLKKFSTILIAGLHKAGSRSKISAFLRTDKLDAIVAQGKHYTTLVNQWAKPQLVILVWGSDISELEKKLEQHQQELIDIIYQAEAKRFKRATGQNNKQIQELLIKNHGIKMFVPKDYQLAQNNDSVIWFRKDDVDQSINILIYHGSLNQQVGDPIRLRDKILKVHISSEMGGSYIHTDTLVYKMFRQKSRLGGLAATETRGLWRMKHDFMGGPFTNYLVKDPKNNRFIMVEGFIYAPKLKKRPLMRQLDIIFGTLELI